MGRQYNDQEKRDNIWFTKHYTENQRLNNTNSTKIDGEFRCSGRVSSINDSRRFIWTITYFMKRKFKQWWTKIHSISTKQTTTSYLNNCAQKDEQCFEFNTFVFQNRLVFSSPDRKGHGRCCHHLPSANL
jgi:hypothetical protein